MLGALGLATWFIAPLFLPVWQWLNVDFKQLAQELKLPEEELSRQYTMILYFHKRGKDDPVPWQVVSCDPPFTFGGVDEYETSVRVNLINNRTGEPPGTLTMGSTYRDFFYTVKAHRLPAGAFGRSGPRPVVLFDADTWRKLGITEARAWDEQVRTHYTDDEEYYPERDDQWVQPVTEESDDGEKPPEEPPLMLPGQ
jgi:hypothetical protein